MRLFVLAAMAALCLQTARSGRAQDACAGDSAEPGELQLTPSPGSPAPVRLDSPIVARFPGDVDVGDHATETLLSLSREQPDGTLQRVGGTYDTEDAQPNVLVFRPEGGLEEGARYRGVAEDPLDSSRREVTFEAGQGLDETPPGFERAATLTLDAAAGGADCAGTRVDVAFTPAFDDGPRGSVEHLVYQTRGASLPAPVLRGRVRATMDSQLRTSFLLAPGQDAQPVCVQVLPVDGTGRVGEPLGPECFSPDANARFAPACSARGGALPVRAYAAWLWMAAGVALWRASRRLRVHGRRR